MQHALLNELDRIQDVVRSVDDLGKKIRILQDEMVILDSNLLQQKVKLPIHPSFDCCGIRLQSCSVFNSNAKPLKVVFRGLDKDYAIIHKKDDDMRQDAFVLMMVNEMVRIWKANDLDLRIVTFRVMPVGYKKGMGELVSNCATLLEIQKDDGFTGVMKDEVLQKWLEKHNTSEFTFKEASENFTRSCAAWCVITYVLGIGDRHNDNILVTTKGHVFHIDFGKYMGDWQMAAGFRRDRVPFVFTSEMFFVINGGRNQATESYQTFIDYCCKAFNCLRRNRTNLTNLLRMMACSDVPGINMDSLAFVEKNLMLDLSETNATMQFTEMIQSSLKSLSTRLNFVAHTLAQFMSSSSSFTKKDNSSLSFIPQLYTVQTDGRIKDVRVRGFEKRNSPSKVYLYKIEVVRENISVPHFVYRSFAEFEELHEKLRKRFPMMQLSVPSGGSRMRSNVRAAAHKRMSDIELYLRNLFSQPNEIRQCDLVYTFFHSILRDNKNDSSSTEDENMDRSQCQVFLKISHNSIQQKLNVFVGHVKNLAMLPTNAAPDAYVKVYLRPGKLSFSLNLLKFSFKIRKIFRNERRTSLNRRKIRLSIRSCPTIISPWICCQHGCSRSRFGTTAVSWTTTKCTWSTFL
ncbi:hypothetical protein WR25_25786 isoform B [Diploscapter pachys]|uniref:phosphatidylinositol 3-kinase n=1 Tax=Diploscapter pachys TaxID=2018661 RepID=A0A2A2JGW7_9BILA|nr:hypothetical protein WR25_25786 isoform B [Diploscapter pachys]